MKKHSEEPPDWHSQRNKIIGLGESSIRKSYYPELQQKMAELEKKNEDLKAACEELSSSQEELRQNYEDLSAKERELRESEAKYRNLIDNTFDGVVIHRDQKIVFANQTAARLSGCTGPEAMIGMSIFKVVHPDYHAIARKRATHALETTQMPRHEKFLHRDGMPYDVETVATPTTWEGSPAVQVAFRDITGQRQTEEALKASEIFYRTLFETTGAATVIIEEDTTVSRANEKYAEMTGYSREEIEGKLRWTEFVVPEDLELMKKYHRERRVTPGNVPQAYEFRHINRNGRIYHSFCTVSMIPGTKQSIASVTDITERVNAQQELQKAKTFLEAIYEGSPDPIFVHSADGHITDVNENVLKAFGLTREEAIHANTGEMSGRGYTAEMAMGYIRAALDTGKADFEWVSRRKNGEEFPTEVRLRRLESLEDNGTTEPRILAIVRDITERKMTEKSLEQARKKLGLLNTVVFQDIQSTIFALSAYLQLANNNRDEAKAQSFVEKEAFLIHKIVSSLAFARNYQDMGVHPPRWQNVNQVFLYAISHLDSLKVARTVKLDNLEIYADPLLEKVFFNVIENVFLHGQHVTEIFLSYRETSEGVLIIIGDNGVGIPADEKQKIFERGYGKNTGLGLFMVREVLSITGMSIRERGVEGTGAQFEILVPKGACRFSPA
jgi:PAS domain S-box-containing protein